MVASVRTEGLSRAYDDEYALVDINAAFEGGTVTAVLGPNGAGKSTIFNLICGILKPKQGKIFIDGKDATNFPIYERSKTFLISFLINSSETQLTIKTSAVCAVLTLSSI